MVGRRPYDDSSLPGLHPGFKRLTKAQYTRTVTDMYGRLAAHLIARRDALGLAVDDYQRGFHDAASMYQKLMTGLHMNAFTISIQKIR